MTGNPCRRQWRNSSGRGHSCVSARDWILASATLVMLVFSSHAGLAQRRDWIAPPLDLEVPEDGLDDPTGYDDMQFFSDRLWWTGCRTRICTIWFTIAELYYDSHMGRGPQGSDCLPGLRECPGKIRVTSQRLDGKINAHAAWHRQLCDAIAAVAERDSGTAAETHPDFGAYTLDLARRLTTPKLACLTKVWRALQPGPHRDEAMERALSFCRDERASARECTRLTAATRGAGSSE